MKNMKIAFDKAERVAARLSRKLGTPDWFLGVGIEPYLREGFMISVRVQHGHSQDVALPDRINGVKVKVVERSIARSLTAVTRVRAAVDGGEVF